MFLNDLGFILYWWVILLVLGIVSLPVTLLLLGKLRDKGYIFSKVLAYLFITYGVWLLGSIKILPYGFTSIIIFCLFFAAVNGFIFFKKKHLFNNLPWKLFLAEEVIFLIGFSFWSYVKATNPEIRGLEKFMDYGFVNSIMRTRFFPPADMWLPPLPINYYYFGHTITAVLTTLTGLDSAITYNLMLGVLFGLCFVGSFSLTLNLVSYFLHSEQKNESLKFPIFAGVIAGLLNTLGGNLHTIVYVLKNGADKYWYPDATRYIPYTIHEFPLYSFVVSDLHGHVLDIPTVFLILSLILAFFVTKKKILLPVLGWVLGCSFMTNAWNLPIYLMVAAGVFLIVAVYKKGVAYDKLIEVIKNTLLVFVVSVVTALPFHLAFKQIAKGVLLVDARSPLYQLLVLWGFPLFITVSFLLFLFRGRFRNVFKRESIVTGVASFFGVQIQILKDKGNDLVSRLTFTDGFILILLLVSWLLIVFPEIFYIKDIYIKEYHRANTMFKFVYQSFMMFAVASGYIFVRIVSNGKKNWLFFICYLLFFTSVMIYPYFAIRSYYNSFKNYKGLDGRKFWQTLQPDDYKTILWIGKNISGQPTILEAVGESYTDYSRISAFTGIPCVLGWPVHEWLWRGSYDEAGKRTADVALMYESDDLKAVKDLLKKYNVQYAVVGNLEREKYKNIKEKNFPKLGKIIYDAGKTKVYKIN